MVTRFTTRWLAVWVLLVWVLVATAQPRYVFLFIGDGMGPAQRHLAEVYLAAVNDRGPAGLTPLAMNAMPVAGTMVTAAANDYITDSAAAVTAIACATRTDNGVLGCRADGQTPLHNVAEAARDRGMKVGIISSVSLNHATPAGFYAHVPSRNQYHDIALLLPASGFDYFGGGGFYKLAKGTDIWALARGAGYTVVRRRAELTSLTPDAGPVLAVNHTLDPQAALYYEIDRPADHLSLAEFVRDGIARLEGPAGFFMMVEGGKIDWACHANDTATVLHDILALDAAVAEALAFQQRHPEDTLILVTADHECGGLALGTAVGGKTLRPEVLAHQQCSGLVFYERLAAFKKRHADDNPTWQQAVPLLRASFGFDLPDTEGPDSLVLTDADIAALEDAFAATMNPQGAPDRARYGAYDPLYIWAVRTLAGKAGLGWSSFNHTAVPVPVTAAGPGAEAFAGYYDIAEFGRRLFLAIDKPPTAGR